MVCPPFIPFRQRRTDTKTMRAETEVVIDDIKQAISLLRRHL